jgi:ketosteroid isomerase-like protein
MSKENVEAVDAWLAALHRRDLPALLELADSEVVYRSYLASLAGDEEAYRGHEGLGNFLRDLGDAWEWFHVETIETRDLGDTVFQLGSLQARGRSSGLEVSERFAWLHHFREGTGTGRYLGVERFSTAEDALQAVGLSE